MATDADTQTALDFLGQRVPVTVMERSMLPTTAAHIASTGPGAGAAVGGPGEVAGGGAGGGAEVGGRFVPGRVTGGLPPAGQFGSTQLFDLAQRVLRAGKSALPSAGPTVEPTGEAAQAASAAAANAARLERGAAPFTQEFQDPRFPGMAFPSTGPVTGVETAPLGTTAKDLAPSFGPTGGAEAGAEVGGRGSFDPGPGVLSKIAPWLGLATTGYGLATHDPGTVISGAGATVAGGMAAAGMISGLAATGIGALAAVPAIMMMVGAMRDKDIERGYARTARAAASDFTANPDVQAAEQNITRYISGDRSALPNIQNALAAAVKTGQALSQPDGGSAASVTPYIRDLYAAVIGTEDFGPTVISTAKAVFPPDPNLATGGYPWDQDYGTQVTYAYDALNELGIGSPAFYGPPPGYKGTNPSGVVFRGTGASQPGGKGSFGSGSTVSSVPRPAEQLPPPNYVPPPTQPGTKGGGGGSQPGSK